MEPDHDKTGKGDMALITCEDNHNELVYESFAGGRCPACQIREELEKEIEYLKNKIESLDRE